MNRFAWGGIAFISALLVVGKATGDLKFSWLEVVGFITGLACVWLAVRNSHWTWPIGNVESAAYLLFFFNNRLFANSFLQFVFIVVGFWGWYQWLRGEKNVKPRPIGRTPRRIAFVLLILTPFCTVLVSSFVSAIQGNAPFWDTLTTVLSLIATFIMGRRYIENWWVWSIADVIYIALFSSNGLYLTTALYVIYLIMCIRGWWEWRARLLETKHKAIEDGNATQRGDRQVLPVS